MNKTHVGITRRELAPEGGATPKVLRNEVGILGNIRRSAFHYAIPTALLLLRQVWLQEHSSPAGGLLLFPADKYLKVYYILGQYRNIHISHLSSHSKVIS